MRLAVPAAVPPPDPFVNRLAELCREWPTRAKWVFVPSHALGRTIGERLALGGTNWLNLRFVTPLDIALRMGAPFLVDRGIDPSEEGLGPALVMRLMLELHENARYFRPLADQPTMAQAVWATVRELRMCGIGRGAGFLPQAGWGTRRGLAPGGQPSRTALPASSPVWPARGDGDRPYEALPADAFEDTAKHAELSALLSAYERFLSDNRRADMADVYVEAMNHPDWCPIQPQDCWTELPDVVWAPLQRRLMDTVPGERVLPAALALPGSEIPRRLAEAKVERVVPGRASNPLAFLMGPEPRRDVPRERQPVPSLTLGRLPFDAPEPVPADRDTKQVIALFHGGGREAEIDEVFRRILRSGASLDQVEIVCASDAHVALVWEKALRQEWPVTLGPGIPASSTRPGRALLGLCDWIETDFSAAHLRHLLQSGDMGLEKEDEGFTAGQAARTIARAEAGWGRATYDGALGLLRRTYDARAGDPDRPDDEREAARDAAALTAKVQDWVTTLIASIPEPDRNGCVPLQDVVATALTYLERSTARSSQLDHRAATALAEHVADLRALGPFACELGEALRFVRERVQSLQVAPERPRPGHLFACSLAQACYSDRPHLFIVGLEEGRVFPGAVEDPVLLDAERSRISPALRCSTDRIDEAVFAVPNRLAAWRVAPGGVATFSYSTRDTREFRETYASWLTLQAYRLQQGDGSLSYPQMKAALGEPVSSVPHDRDNALSAAGWWLRSVVSAGQTGREVVETWFEHVAHGRRAEAERASGRFTRFDGHVPAAGGVLDPCRSGDGRPLSVTELEGLAGCPFRFFLKRGLGLRPVDVRERDRDVWLDPLTRGSELHDIYAALLRRSRGAKRRPDRSRDADWLRGLAERRLAALHREMPAARREIFERESRDFLADVELFLDGESERSGPDPVGIEVSFGRPLDGDGEPLARAEAVEIDVGDGLRFRIAGRIDRIDKVGPHEFQIVDYKTGGYWPDDWKGSFMGGRRLQHALYGLAAAELLRTLSGKPGIRGGVYDFCTYKGRRERVEISAPPLATIAQVLGDLRSLILAGAFVHAPDEKDCRFCDYKAACNGAVHEQAAGKLGDPLLQPFGRLTAHE